MVAWKQNTDVFCHQAMSRSVSIGTERGVGVLTVQGKG